MATASEITGYIGVPNLGFGTNPDVPTPLNVDFQAVQQADRDLVFQEAARNKYIYEKKVQERDNLIQGLATGKVKLGKMLDQDRGMVKKALDGQSAAFKNWMKKGYGDIDGATAYQAATQEAEQAALQANMRWALSTKDSDEAAKETIPELKAAKQKQIADNLKDFYGDWKPYQETLRFDPADINKVAQPITKSIYDKKNAVTGTDKYYSLSDAITKSQDVYSTDKGRELGRQLSNKLAQDPSLLNSINAQLGKYNKERGLNPGDPDYAESVDFTKDTPEAIMAKYALSRQPQFLISERKSDNALLDYRAAAARLGLDWTKFNRAQGEDINSADAVVNEATDIIKKGTPTQVDRGGKTVEVLRIGDPTLLQKFGTIDKDGNVTNPPDAIDYDKATDQLRLIYYEGKTASGKNKIVKEVPLDQRTWLKEITKRSFPNKDIGGINEQVDKVLTKSGNSLYKLSQTYGNPSKPEGEKTEPTKPTGKTYKVNGYDYSEQEIIDAAKQLGMTKEAYIKKYKIK